MRFLIRILPFNSSLESATQTVKGIASSIGGKAVNAKRTTYGALEMDIFVPSRQDFELFLAAVEPLGKFEFFKDLQEVPPFLPKSEAIAEAVSLFNAERFWEAHEVLESLWRVAKDEEKLLLQGLILVCAAFVHLQKSENDVALGVAERSLPLLSWNGKYHGLAVGAFRDQLDRMVKSRKLSFIQL